MTSRTTEDMVDALAAIPDTLDALVRASSGVGRSSGQADSWSPSEIAGHLCDSARYWGARMFRVAHEDQPALPAFDEQMMVALAGYRYRPLDELLAAFRLLSAGNVALLRSLNASGWDRTGIHETRGTMTLWEIVAVETEHEEGHVRQFAEAMGVAAK